MRRVRSDDVELLLQRTQGKEGTPGPDKERRYIFGGGATTHPGYAIRQNKRGIKRKGSTFNIILLLFCCGVAIILYVSNILTVNRLAYEVDQLQTQYNKIVETNRVLEAEINRKSAFDRISRLAQDIGLDHPTEQPEWISVDQNKLKELSGR